jgi:hypothetical protein
MWARNTTTAFFTADAQMGVPELTLPGLAIEGITTPDDLLDFNEDDLKTVMSNLRRPAGTIPDPADATAVIPRPSYEFGAKSFKRLKIAALAVSYYDSIGRPCTPDNMHFNHVLKDFSEQWESLVEKKDETVPDVPTITRALPIVRWTECFDDFLHQVIGHRMVPLAYLIRSNEEVENPAPPLAHRRSYSETHGSVEAELIARVSHTHNRFRDDNAKLFAYLEVATRSTQYAASIRPFARRKNGRGAYLALVTQYAGKDKWQEEIKKQENFIHNRLWKGNSNFSLESFITQHRSAHVSLQRCAEHVPHQLPNERTRVIHLIDAIQTSDAPLQAALARIKSDDGVDGMMNHFENASAYLLQFDPVAKKRKQGAGHGRQQQISGVNQDHNDGGFEMKPNKGNTGVELRYYSFDEYNTLSNPQRRELKEFRANKRKSGDKDINKKPNKRTTAKDKKEMRKQIISCLKEYQEEVDKDETVDSNEARDFILSVVNQEKSVKMPPKPSAIPTKAPSALQRIIKHASKGSA